MKKNFYIALFCFSFIGHLEAQCNLVLNPSFEIDTSCYNGSSAFQLSQVLPWNSPSDGSPDLLQRCAYGMFGGSLPSNNEGFQQPHSGDNFARFATYVPSYPDYREYIQDELESSLLPNKTYCVSFYVNLPDFCSIASNNMGIYFSDTSIFIPTILNLRFTPQIVYTSIITDTMNWTEISGTYIAHGGERYIIIGNFYSDSLTDTTLLRPFVPISNRDAVYYLDDVDVHLCNCNVVVQEESLSREINISPNPFTSQTTITFSEDKPHTLKLTDLLGKDLKTWHFTGKELKLDRGDLKSGIYFLQITDEKNKVTNKKIVIE